jgi:hypothetical protein
MKIEKKIISYKVKTQEEPAPPQVEVMHEAVARPELLHGSTYKIKTPDSAHALYITINDVILQDTRFPYEIFINSKNMDNYQWVVALTRLISAVFRKGGNVTFMVDELKAVFAPSGGYFKKGGVFMPSLVAEIGHTLETHLKHIGVIKVEVDQHQQAFIAAKREEMGVAEGEFPASAQLCPKCNVKAAVLMDGCRVCLSCGDSKCS